MNQPVLAATGHDAAPPRWSGSLGRRAVLLGLGVLLLGGCACWSRTAKSPTPKTAAYQSGSPPKTVGEFMKQPPSRLPFNDKE